MAVQNFLSGGYYGKLGETVGQRWKNKRTIRTYVIPKNPRTEKQQANRGLFANAVTFAQIGMQMNYYATCFLSEEFTQWNYRMRVARQLREKGLSGLDLIPLYPLSFTPATLITKLEVSEIVGGKHFILKCDNLQGNNDRVLSVMFDVHNDKGEELGYKLYIGYYYASKKGFMEIDVDDPTEINEYLKVRIVSNDDVNSTTDLISSPTITIQSKQIDIRDFDTSIKSFSKDNQGITIIFNELWKDGATTNIISGNVRFVQNGNTVSHIFDSEPLTNSGGYCSLFIPLVSSSNQYLPAFPEGSKISITEVNFSGSDFQYTKQNVSSPLVDTDLTRTLDAPSNSSANNGVTLVFNFPYSGSEQSLGSGNVLSHYWISGKFEQEFVFKIKQNAENKLELYPDTNGVNLPMLNGDYISTPEVSFVQNGVAYRYNALIGYSFENTIRETTWTDNIFDLTRATEVWWGDPEGGDPSRVDLPLKSELLPDDYFEEYVTSKKAGDYFELNLNNGTSWRVPSSVNSGDIKLIRDAVGEPARLAVEFYKTYAAPQNAVSCTLFGGAFKLVYNGVTYNAPSVDKLFDNMNNIPY